MCLCVYVCVYLCVYKSEGSLPEVILEVDIDEIMNVAIHFV